MGQNRVVVNNDTIRVVNVNEGGSNTMTSFVLAGDSGSSQTISNGNTLDIAGGTGIDTVASATDTVTVSVDSTVATLTGSQTLTNKTIDGDDNTIQDLPITSLKSGVVETTLTDSDSNLASSGGVFDHVAGITLNNQTGTTYELVLTDRGKLVTLNNASAITLTIPANASVAFPIGTQIELLQLGAGQVTVAITSDTLNSSGAATKLTGQYSSAVITKIDTTTWVMVGDITT